MELRKVPPPCDFYVKGNSWFTGSYFYLQNTDFQQSVGSTGVTSEKTTADDTAAVYSTTFDYIHNLSNTFNYSYGFFKGTATTGSVSVAIHKPDLAGTINHLFSGNGNSYLAANNGNVGIGIASPTQKLHVNGAARITNLLLSSGQQFVGYAAAAPTTGTYVRGSVIFNNAPVASGFVGWVCVLGGTPGTWKAFGMISA